MPEVRGITGVCVEQSSFRTLTALLGLLPANSGLAVLVEVRATREQRERLWHMLEGASEMPVKKPVAGDRPEPSRIYLAPGGSTLCVDGGSFRFGSVRNRGSGDLGPFDLMLCSLAREQGVRSAGVLLANPAGDGRIGLEAIEAVGGFAISRESIEGAPGPAAAAHAIVQHVNRLSTRPGGEPSAGLYARLQSAIEELAVKSEELSSVNEELRASREELERTNQHLSDAREELELTNQGLKQLQQIYATAPVGLAVLDRECCVVTSNAALAEIHGRKPEEESGASLFELLPSFEPVFRPLVEEVFRTGAPRLNVERSVPRADGSRPRHWVASLVPLPGDGSPVETVSCVIQEVSERAHYEEALRNASRQKDDFLALLGHELRNPLAAISGSHQLQSMIELDHPTLQKTRDIIGRQVAQMTRMVHDLLDVSRIARGKVPLVKSELDLCEVAREVVEDRRLTAKGITLELLTPDERVWLIGDRGRLTQALDNLVGNAIKFSEPPGAVTVSVRPREEMVELRVRDDGVGFEPEECQDLFELFSQSRDLTRSGGGMGVGLALVRSIAKLHGGRIYATSRGRGRGAEFVLEIPRVPAKDQPAGPVEAAPF